MYCNKKEAEKEKTSSLLIQECKKEYEKIQECHKAGQLLHIE